MFFILTSKVSAILVLSSAQFCKAKLRIDITLSAGLTQLWVGQDLSATGISKSSCENREIKEIFELKVTLWSAPPSEYISKICLSRLIPSVESFAWKIFANSVAWWNESDFSNIFSFVVMYGVPVIKELLMESGMSQTKTTDGTSPKTFQSWSNASITTFFIPRDQLCVLTFVDTVCNGY